MDPIVSYYNGDAEAVRGSVQSVLKQLQVDGGLLNRLKLTDLELFFWDADRWVEEKLREWYQIPFKRVRIKVPNNQGGESTVLDFPPAVKYTTLYRAAMMIVTSEYFENEPNASQAAVWLEKEVGKRLLELRHRTRLLSGNRAKHPNSFMPPEVAPLVNEEKEEL